MPAFEIKNKVQTYCDQKYDKMNGENSKIIKKKALKLTMLKFQ